MDQQRRYNCPVCVGTQMTKVTPLKGLELMLDHCKECGGIWFDQGEVALLRKCHPRALRTKVVLKEAAYRVKCRACGATMSRNDPRCPACGQPDQINCPVCHALMRPVRGGDIKLDACERCRGVWFDNVELAHIWNLTVGSSSGSGPQSQMETETFTIEACLYGAEEAMGLAEVLTSGPEGSVTSDVAPTALSTATDTGAIEAGGDILEAPHEAISGAVEAATATAEQAGELGGSFFEAIAGIIEVVFSVAE